MYNAVERLKLWQQGRDDKTLNLAASIGQREMKECTFSPQIFSQKRTKNILVNKKDQFQSPSAKQHSERMEQARQKRKSKNQVPHITGKNWSGKTTIAKAPQLSCFRKKKTRETYSKTDGYSKKLSSSSSSSSSSTSKNVTTFSGKKIQPRRGSFSSPRAVKPQEKIQPPSFIHSDKDAGEAKKNAIERSRPVPASTYTNNNSESVATEFVDSNISLADELVMLRNQLQAEEKRRLSLTAQKKSYSINVGSSVAAPAAPAAPASNFSYIAPPAPPPGPPPGPPPRPPSNNRSGKQSPLPFNDMEVLHRPIGTVEVTRVPVPCVPVPSVPVPSVPVPRVEANQVDTRHMNVDHCNLKNSRLSRIGLLQNQTADNSCYDYIDDNENNNENGNQKNINSNKKESKPNWKLIQQAMTSMMVKNVQKRKESI